MGLFGMKTTETGRWLRMSFALTTLSGSLALGQATTTLVIPQGPLLPVQFGTWHIEPTGRADATPSPLVNGKSAEVLKEDGLTRSSEETYSQNSRPGSIKLDAFQFDDATGAVAAFTYLQSPEMKEVPRGSRVGRDEVTAGGRYLIRDGATVVLAEVNSPTGSTVDDLRTMAATLPKIGGPKGASPLLPTLLPEAGRISGSTRYAVGPIGYAATGGTLPGAILGFEKSAEAATAEYSVHGGKGVLTLLLFPTPQIAGDRGRALEAALNAAGERAGTAKLRREGPMLILAKDGFTPEEAQALVDSVHLRQEVTWNKPVPPEFHTEVRKTASLLVSIAIFSGVLGLAAVLLGLFLGFGRAWVRVLMGKPAATEPEFLRLNLSNRAADGGAGRKTAGV